MRNSNDVACMSVPNKFKAIGDFHEYYSGRRIAPYLTIFIGGNHEASNYLFELYYGGWVAPNIYYLGAANVIRCGPLRIAGMSGIWKGYDYRKPHYERLPYNQDDIHGIYHVRELDVRKLLQIRTQVDLGLSHDWPKGVELLGDYESLFRRKTGFRKDSNQGRLGSVAAKYVLDRLRPAYWFSAHLHVKYAASIQHGEYIPARGPKSKLEPASQKSSLQAPQPQQAQKIPYSFGLDGSILTSMLDDDEESTAPNVDHAQQDTGDNETVPRTQNDNVVSEPNKTEPGPASEITQDIAHESPENKLNADPGSAGITHAENTQDPVSAWNNFYHVAAENEAVERARFDEGDRLQGGRNPDTRHDITWHRVDVGEDGVGRRFIETERPEILQERESKKQKVEHGTDTVKNSDEIDLDLDSDSDNEVANAATSERKSANEHGTSSKASDANMAAENTPKGLPNEEGGVPEELRSQLPASFARPEPAQTAVINGPLPRDINNTVTQFLALDKCLPRNDFLQLTEFHTISDQDNVQSERPYRLQYDKEWLAITRVFANDLHLGDPNARASPDKGDLYYEPLIKREEEWIEENVVKPGKLTIPDNFTPTAPFYDPSVPVDTNEMPPEYPNPQTAQFCELIGIENKFRLSDEERQARMEAGPRPEPEPKGPPRFQQRGRRGGNRGPRRWL